MNKTANKIINEHTIEKAMRRSHQLRAEYFHNLFRYFGTKPGHSYK